MNPTEIFDQVKSIVAPYCKNEQALAEAKESTTFLADLSINSARLVDIVIDFEDEFDIEIADDEADKIQNFSDAVSLIKQKVA